MNEQPTTEDYCRTHLLCYSTYMFGNYQIAKHHQAIAAHLEALERREIKKLLITMPPRHGKCVTEETLITKDSMVRVFAKDIKPGDRVLGCDDAGKICINKVVATEPARKETITIKTRSGRTFTASHDHPMLTQRGYIPLEQLTLEDSLMCLNMKVTKGVEIDKDELIFITMMIFEGCCNHNVIFTNQTKTVVSQFLSSCRNLNLEVRKLPNAPEFAVRAPVRDLLKKYGINKHLAYTKRLPPSFFQIPINQKWSFIDIMFQTDGYFCQKAGTGGIALANEKLIDDIQSLLATCKIASSKTYKHNDTAGAWVLNIGRSQLKAVYENCDLGEKRNQCASIINKPHNFSLLTTFPWQIAKRLKGTRKNGFRCDNKKNITTARMERLVKVYPELGSFLNMDFFYDQVMVIEKSQEQPLIHIETTGSHNFIANDFVSHNTMLASEFFPAYYLGRNPSHEIIFSTYSGDRALDIGQKVKNQLISDDYTRVFETRLDPSSKSKSHLSTTQGGAMYSVGVGGPITGRGANLFLMDDLVKSREEAESESFRKRLDDWFRGTAFTRLMPGGVLCLITTRWHTQDLAGVILDRWGDDWVHLNLPAVCETETDMLGRQRGEALWPEFYNVKALSDIKDVIGSREFDAQYQQRPTGGEGALIDIAWFQRYASDPETIKFKRIIQSWDTAYESGKRNDPSVCTVWGQAVDRKNNVEGFFLLDVWRKRAEYPDVKKAVYAMYQKWPQTQHILVENRTSGISIVKDLQNTALPIKAIKSGGSSKEVRLIAVTGTMEAGRVFLPEKAPWLYDYETELAQFPSGKHDDQVDSTTQALEFLRKPSFMAALQRPMFWK